MRARNWVILILINIAISATVIVAILFIWSRAQPSTSPSPVPTATPTPELPGQMASMATAELPTVPPPTPSPQPILYTVQEGDTLSAIALAYGVSLQDLMTANAISDPNILSVGQVLVIPIAVPPTLPAEPPTPEPTRGPLPPSPATITPSGPPLVEIGQVLGSDNLAAETVIVRNRGGWVSLEGWTLSDAEGNTFIFPALTLFEGAQVRIHSAAGISTPTDLYWGRTTPAWNGGELITLRDAAGNVVNTYIVP